MAEERRVVLHVHEDVTPAAVRPVPRDRFATVGERLIVREVIFGLSKEYYVPVNSSEFSTFPRLFINSETKIIPKAKRAPRPMTTP